MKNKPTILFLHGLGIDSSIWKKTVSFLKNKYNIIFLDLPGYGQNIDVKISPKFDLITKFVNDFIKKSGSIDYLIGYSMSGTFLYRIAQDPPTSLKKVICISTPFFESKLIVVLNWIFKIIGFRSIITNIVVNIIKVFPIKQIIFYLGGLASIKNANAMNECMNIFGKNTNLSYIFKTASTIFSPTKFAQINIPVEFIYGENDGFATIEIAKKAQKYCVNSKLKIMDEVFHLAPLEKPEELASLIDQCCD